jgi:hypothetical protein
MTTAWAAELNDPVAGPPIVRAEAAQSIWASLAQEMDINGYRPQPHAKVPPQGPDAPETTLSEKSGKQDYLRLSPEE